MNETVEVDFCVESFSKDDALLICTDGLTNFVSTDDILNPQPTARSTNLPKGLGLLPIQWRRGQHHRRGYFALTEVYHMENYVGKILGNRYRVLELIGVGGMATVYRAYDSIDDRTVAIKILKDEFLANEEFRRRFKTSQRQSQFFHTSEHCKGLRC